MMKIIRKIIMTLIPYGKQCCQHFIIISSNVRQAALSLSGIIAKASYLGYLLLSSPLQPIFNDALKSKSYHITFLLKTL